MEVPMNYEGPAIEVIVREIKVDNTPQVIDQLVSHILPKSNVATYLKDKIDGTLT